MEPGVSVLMRDKQNCIDCGKQSPETDTNYTLISSQFGWRLTRQRLPDGSFAVEWRCPDCWREHKRGKTDEKPSATTPSAPTRPAAGKPPPATPSGAKVAAARPPSYPPRSGPSSTTTPAVNPRDRVHSPLKPR
jgi:hypothetical protein